MSLASSIFRVHSIFNRLIPPPYYCNTINQRLEICQNYNKIYYKLFRLSCLSIFFLAYLPICIHRLSWLCFHWKSYSSHNIQQVFIHSMFICIILIVFPAFNIFKTQTSQIIFLTNEICRLGATYKNPVTRKIGLGNRILQKVKEWFAFIFALPFMLLVPAIFSSPFVFNYLPMQLVFGNSIVVKIIAGVIYSSTTAYGASCILSVLLIAILCLENFIIYTSSICSRKCALSTKLFFIVCFRRFRVTQILIRIGNIIFDQFLTMLIFVGIVLASCATYTTAKLYNRISFVAYLLSPSIAITSFMIALLLTYLANIPYDNSKLFRKNWILVLKREQRRMLLTCRPFGFQLGPYGIVTAKLGLSICDDIVRNSVTMILLDSI